MALPATRPAASISWSTKPPSAAPRRPFSQAISAAARGAVTRIYTPAVGAGIYGMRFDPQNSKLYFAQVDPGWPSVTTATGIYTINEDGTGLSKLVSFTGADSATTFAIDTADNLLFFTNGGFNTNPVESVEVA